MAQLTDHAVAFAKESYALSLQGFAALCLLFWYALAIYLVIVTLGVQQFVGRPLEGTMADPARYAELRAIDAKEREIRKELEWARQRQAEAQRVFDARKAEADQSEAMIGAAEVSGTVPVELKAQAAATRTLADRAWESLKWETTQRDQILERLENLQSKIVPTDLEILENIRKRAAQSEQLDKYASIFLTMPREVLTLVLTLSMGVFGSTIHVTRVFFGGSDPSASNQRIWYIFRPIQGAVMAMAVYILFKAGVLVFSAPATAGDTASGTLNPFVIAFLGVISGLFSEQAYARLDQAARNLLKGDSSNPC